MQKKILTLLVLLMTAVTGVWAQEQSETIATTNNNIVEGTHFTISNNGSYVDEDGMSADWGITVTPKNGETITKVVISCTLNPDFVNDGNTTVSSGTKEITNGGGTITVTGVNASTFTFTCSNYEPLFGQFVVYYTEAPAGPAESIDLTTTDNLTWTLASMPGCDVELELEYYDYPAATLTAAPTAKTDLLFTGQPLDLITAGTATNGTLYYALGTADAAPTEASDWSTDVPTASAAGKYYVWYKVLGDDTHNGIDPAGPLTVTIKANITAADVTAPTAVENLKYKGVPQALIVAGSVTGDIGTMYYRLGTDGTWSTDIPTATDKGDYTVYYKVVGDDLHNDYVPAGSIAVTIGEGAEMAAQLTVNGNTGTSCTAMLLDAATYQPLTSGVKAGDKFILSTVKEDGYDFNVTGASTTEFTNEDYQAYFEYATNNDISVSLNTVLFWVTMPHVESGNLNLAVTFKQLDTYTVLYQPASGSNPDVVACKMERSVNNTPEVSYLALQRGATMDNGTAVWTMKMMAAYAPTKIAFIETDIPSAGEEAALQSKLENAALNNAVISQNTANWNSISGAKYLIIGGNAKVVTASFIADASSMTTYQDNTVNAAESTGGVTYQLGVCVTDAQGRVTTSGTVKAPAAPAAPTGKEFAGWRGFVYDANGKATEKIYTAGATISVRENATFAAVWNPIQVKTTFALNGGKGVSSPATTTYGNQLSIDGTPTRPGYVLDYWTVAKTVSESGVLFSKGSQFDMSTALTANLDLSAKWKHVHDYSCYQISAFGSALANYQKYNGALHIAVCGCNEIDIVAHEFNKAGRCACGYTKPGAQPVQLNYSYGQWNGSSYSKFIDGFPEDYKRGEEAVVEAPHNWGNLEFKTWQYSTNNGQSWEDLAAFETVGFLIPCDIELRALYVNPVTTPTIELASSHYDDKAEYQGKTYTMGNIMYQMDYKLPDGYKLLDAGIRMGDNSGISYYFIQQVRYSLDNESKGIMSGISAGVAGLGLAGSFLGAGGFDVISFAGSVSDGMFAEEYGVNYLETEYNVMEKEEMDAATLAKKMYEGTPINVPKYDPIYWESQAQTKGLSGSVTTLPPLRFAQKNNQDHYIYGIGYMRYKDNNGNQKTLYTDAIAATVNNPDHYTVKMEQMPGARLMNPDSNEMATAARRAPRREPEQPATAELLDKSTITVSQAQLVVYVDGTYSASLSDNYGCGETVSVKAPAVSGKTFSYWTTDDGAVISTDQTLTLTINAQTTLHAVYGGESKTAKPAITSVTRTNDGEKIVIQAIATGTVDAAGIVYSTTATEPTIGADGVTKVEAVKYSNLPTTGSQMPASVLDKNNCFSLQITPADETTVYYARAYATVGGSTTYSDVKSVTLADLKSGVMMIANLAAFEPGFDDALAEVQNSILILDEMTDNSEVLTEWDGNEANITLKRKLVAGSWNTLAVPFNVSSQMLGHLTSTYGMQVKELTSTSLANEGKTLMLNFTDATEMVAGTPYLVKVTSDFDFSAQALPNVEVSKELNPVETKYADFIPTLGKTTIENVAAENVLFVAAENKLKNPSAIPTDMKGFRGYFLLKNLPAAARAFALNIDGEITGIDATLVNSEKVNSDVYDLQGRKVNAAQKGVYIMNGKKVIK